MLALLPLALAHGDAFEVVALSTAGPDVVWAVVSGWGAVHTTDGGATWTWTCEEVFGDGEVEDALALGDGGAWVAWRDGLFRVAEGGDPVAVPGLPEGTWPTRLLARGDGVLAFARGADEGGAWACDADGCVATEGVGAGLFPKSAVADGGRAWTTVTEETTLAAALWRSDDGRTWTTAARWPDGDLDPYVLSADGDTLIVWLRPRGAGEPVLTRSTDGGATWTDVLALGDADDAPPGLLALGDGPIYVGSATGMRTWRSEDRGATWTETSLETPAIGCGAWDGERGWACAERIGDGFDLAVTRDGIDWTPAACLESATARDAEVCDADAFRAAALAWGDGRCDDVVAAPAADETRGCGCGSEGATAILVPLLWVGRRATRPRPSSSRRGRSGR